MTQGISDTVNLAGHVADLHDKSKDFLANATKFREMEEKKHAKSTTNIIFKVLQKGWKHLTQTDTKSPNQIHRKNSTPINVHPTNLQQVYSETRDLHIDNYTATVNTHFKKRTPASKTSAWNTFLNFFCCGPRPGKGDRGEREHLIKKIK